MASASRIKAGQAYVEISLEDKLSAGLDRIAARYQKTGRDFQVLGAKMFAIGVSGLTGLSATVKIFESMGSSLKLMSERTGIGVQALSGLKFAADSAGVEVDGLEVGIRKMQKAIVSAADGSQETTRALNLLGLSVANLRGLAPDQQLGLIGDRIGALNDPTLKAAEATALFGKSGTDLLPLLNSGPGGISAMSAKLKELGGVMNPQDAQAALNLKRRFDELGMSTRVLTFNIGSALAPAASVLTRGLTQATVANL